MPGLWRRAPVPVRNVFRRPRHALEMTVSEPATVTVGGKPLDPSAVNRFSGSVSIGNGTTPFTITAKDASGNTTSEAFEVDSAGSAKTFTFDANGNMTSDGLRTFHWDARNQLTSVVAADASVTLEYDGMGRRVRQTKLSGGQLDVDDRLLWCDAAPCEERSVSGDGSVTRRFAKGLITKLGSHRLLVSDHLGSVRASTTALGQAVTRVEYNPFGRVENETGSEPRPMGFTGQSVESVSGLGLAVFRAYSPETGTWLSEDPLFRNDSRGGADRVALYRYVENRPVRFTDPLGWVTWDCDYSITAISEGVGGGVFMARCVSRCTGGKQVTATVTSTVLALSAGSPVTAIRSKATLEDGMTAPDAQSLVGVVLIAGFGYAFPLLGGKSWTAMKIGKAEVPNQNRAGEQSGLDLSIGGYGGYSALLRSDQKPCCTK